METSIKNFLKALVFTTAKLSKTFESYWVSSCEENNLPFGVVRALRQNPGFKKPFYGRQRKNSDFYALVI